MCPALSPGEIHSSGITESREDARKSLPRVFRAHLGLEPSVEAGEEAEAQGHGEPQPCCKHLPRLGVTSPPPVPLTRFPQDTQRRRPHPTGGGKTPGRQRQGQVPCCMNSSSHFQQLANPLRAPCQLRASLRQGCGDAGNAGTQTRLSWEQRGCGRSHLLSGQPAGSWLCVLPLCHPSLDESPLRPGLPASCCPVAAKSVVVLLLSRAGLGASSEVLNESCCHSMLHHGCCHPMLCQPWGRVHGWQSHVKG